MALNYELEGVQKACEGRASGYYLKDAGLLHNISEVHVTGLVQLSGNLKCKLTDFSSHVNYSGVKRRFRPGNMRDYRPRSVVSAERSSRHGWRAPRYSLWESSIITN